MGRREKDEPPHWQCRWPNPHVGRYWKRQLSKARRRFARPESLIVGRIYRTLPDEDAAKHNLIRVIDETHGEPGSEDGYLYPTSMFVPIELPKVAEQMLMSAGTWAQQPA